LNILLVDDHKLFREGMVYLLQAGLKGEASLSIHEACDCEGALAIAAQMGPDLDLVLLDLNLPDCQGLSALQKFSQQYPTLPILVLSASTQYHDIRRSLECGAMGFVPKESSSSVVISAIRLVQSGSIYVPPVLLDEESNMPKQAAGPATGLTGRQKEVMQLIAEGKSNKEIARELGLAETTVKMHMTHIMRVLDVSNRTQAVVKAERLGWVERF
jgi:DNA-binding NarL/FixJ family response regulator